MAQKSLRKKIAKHEQSKAHNEAAKLLTVKEHESIETDVIKGQDKHKDVTEKCR